MEINPQYSIPDEEITWTYTRSGGPGGQNVNKVASCAILRWELGRNTSLPDHVRERLKQQQKRRLTTEGELLIRGQRFRDQEKNREDCLQRLREMLLLALVEPEVRKATRPTRGSKRRRLDAKRQRSQRKEARRNLPDD